MEGGRVQDNQKAPFEGVPVSGDYPAKYADQISDVSDDHDEPEPDTPADDGIADDDMEGVPEPPESDDHNNPYSWW